MSIFDILESRMQELFEGNRVVSPIAFKGLARQAVSRMKRGAVRIDGGKFAPTLYTIMVSPQDSRMVAPFYLQVTAELEDFLAHEAANLGMQMSDAPVVRMIADSTVKSGKFDVIAEMVPPDILSQLRREEDEYADGLARSVAPGSGGAAASPAPVRKAAPAAAVAPVPPVAPRRVRTAARPTPAAPAATGTGACELRDLRTGQSWTLERDTVIGREQASADLVLADSNVSRRHAQLSFDGTGWTVLDLGSTNGTLVNGQRVDRSALRTGDTLTLGLNDLQFKEL